MKGDEQPENVKKLKYKGSTQSNSTKAKFKKTKNRKEVNEMLETKITFKGNQQAWKLQKECKEKGFTKVADCYWVIIFEKDNKRIILERE